MAATIIVAVLGLVDFSILKKNLGVLQKRFYSRGCHHHSNSPRRCRNWRYRWRHGFAAPAFVQNLQAPHCRGRGDQGNQAFPQCKKTQGGNFPSILTLRVDESLYFGNASYIEDEIFNNLAERDQLCHVILMCTAVNEIDISALEVLESINETLREQGIGFHLSEVKGPVMDSLETTTFLSELNGEVFLSQFQAVQTLLLEDTLLSL